MVNNTVKMMVAALLVLFVSAGAASAADEVLARIGNRVVTQKDIEYLIALYPENEQALLRGSVEYREVLLKNMVTVIVVSDIAKKKNFDKKGDIGKQVELIMNEYLARAYVEQEILGGVTVSDEEIEKYYRVNPSAFESPERLRVRHILITVKPGASEGEKNAAKKKTTDILERAKRGADFAKLAEEYSEDPGSRQKGGDLGYITRKTTMPELEDAAFALEVGEVGGPIETAFGFHLIKVEEKKKASVAPFDQVKEEARAKTLQEAKQKKVNSFIDQAFKDAGVKFVAPVGEKKNSLSLTP
ncbi:MAG TPA: peptidylprolyl isomerase [Syntrophales bacterium]|mgnify:CR=1 FL=1|nr:peptidylprolyl isomerase [Syntrophales bacterium]HRT27465.1 peptidylprolyl isomerase [Syntrophales bacterium]HRT70297.1 peptidylprolyl isomerase [Syntrophales bacterium]